MKWFIELINEEDKILLEVLREKKIPVVVVEYNLNVYVPNEKIIFHGALNTYPNIDSEIFPHFNYEMYDYGKFMETFKGYILNDDCIFGSYSDFLNLNFSGKWFIRPESCWKEFNGFVFEDNKFGINLTSSVEAVVSSYKEICDEERYFIVNGERVRNYHIGFESGKDFVDEVIGKVKFEDVYCMDVCKHNGEWKIVEINPFFGAQLRNVDINDLVGKIMKLSQSHF